MMKKKDDLLHMLRSEVKMIDSSPLATSKTVEFYADCIH